MPSTAAAREQHRDWRSALFALCFVPLFVSLGFWQLSRAEEKREIGNSWEQRRAEAPVALDTLPTAPEALAFRRVVLQGEFLPGRNFLLDNRIREGRYGVEVLSPFRLDSGTVALVNRGWLQGDQYRQQLPEVPAAAGTQVVGYVYVPPGESYTLGDVATGDTWPRLVQAIDMPALAEQMGEQLWPYTVRVNADHAAALIADWPLVNARPEKHEAYAAQWFAMALVLAGIALWRNRSVMGGASAEESEE